MGSARPAFDAESAARLRRVVVRLARTLNDSASAEGMSPTQASVLGIIDVLGPIALSAVAEIEGLNPTMLSRIVSKLDQEELIRRRPHPDDQRAALVEVTELGRATNLRVRTARTETVAKIVGGLPAETVRSLLDALPALEAMAGLEEPRD